MACSSLVCHVYPSIRLLSKLPPAHHRRPIQVHTLCLLAASTHNHPPVEAASMSSTQSGTNVELSKKKCEPCQSKDLKPFNEEYASELLQHVSGWKLVNEIGGPLKLHRSWKAKSYMKGFQFLKLVSDIAESEGHHPDLHLVNWNNVKIDIWTHVIGGLTLNDFILAAKINDIDSEGLMKEHKP